MNSQDSFSSKNQYRLHKYFITFFIALAIGVAIGFSSSSSQADDRDYKYLEIFTEALTLIKKKYVKEVETEHLMDGAIDGMLRSLDPHSSYLTPKMFTQMQSDTSGKFGGLGIEITLSDGWLTVITPFEGTPAWEAGIETGDKILRIDDEATYDMGLMDAVWKMRGKKGTSVKITIFREGLNEPKELNIVRDTITVESVRSELINRDIGYTRIRSFSQSTTNDLKKHIDSLFKAGATKLIVDLRNNPGGLLEQAIDVSSLFIKKGEVLVKTEGRLASLNKTFKSSGNSYSLDIPIIILINKGSASASEIVAGALQDLKRALIIGNQSFGKASVQIIIPLKNDAGIRLTTAHYFTPLGKEIHETGIEPNLIIANIVKKEKLSTNSKKLTEQELIRKMQNKKEEKGAEDDIKNLKRALVDLENDKQLDEAVKLLATKDIFKMIKEVNLNQKEQVANATH